MSIYLNNDINLTASYIRGVVSHASKTVGPGHMNDPLNYALKYFKGVDTAIKMRNHTLRSFSAVFHDYNRVLGGIETSRNLNLDEVSRSIPKASAVAIFIWNATPCGDDPSKIKRTAVWRDMHGYFIKMEENNGRYRIVFASGPNFAMAA